MQCTATGGDSERTAARVTVYRAPAAYIASSRARASSVDLSAAAWEEHSMGKSRL